MSNKPKKHLQGVIIAIPTPLKQNEDVDTLSLCRLLDHCIQEGANGVMIMGTMGEGAALLDSQKKVLVETAVAHTAGRIPVLATVSAASTRKSVEYVKEMNKAGVDYIVSTAPYYNKFPDPSSILIHTQKIAAVSQVPLIFYNAPLFTGNNADADTLEKILNTEGIAGIKDSSCNFSQFVELLRRYPDKNSRPGSIMQGDESVLDASLLMGADGLVSGGGVAYIRLLVDLYQAGSVNNLPKAIACQRAFTKQLLQLLLPDPQRNWLHNIKKSLVDMNIISHAYVTTPFLTN